MNNIKQNPKRAMKHFIALFMLSVFISEGLHSQVFQFDNNRVPAPGALYSRTKQVNQFFRRFNCEEDSYGIRLNKNDSLYRNNLLRKKYFTMLFDLQNKSITANTRNKFIADVSNKQAPVYIDFHGEGWFAEVNTKFRHKNRTVDIVLYLKLEQENLGWKWVITNVNSQSFQEFMQSSGLANDEINPDEKLEFLHPMSHELDFMNLQKVFDAPENPDKFLVKNYQPDYLTLFSYQLKNKELVYEKITKVKFHFLQVSNWYFELSYIERPGYNAGWLISNLLKINKQEKENLVKLMNYVER